MKEDLFNILGMSVQGAMFLDLYCGSGSVGIEALSRKAKLAVFVDEAKASIKLTEANLRKTKLEDKAEVRHMSANAFFEDILPKSAHLTPFDIIFMDPPYDSSELKRSIKIAAENNIIAQGGIIVAECKADTILPDFTGLTLYRRKIYTQTQFVFYLKD